MLTFRALVIPLVGFTTFAAPLAADVFVGDITGDAIRWYSDSGHLKGTLTGNGIDNPFGMTLGPDGLLYVANAASQKITRHDPTTGAFVGTFVTVDDTIDAAPEGVAFGRDGNLYVTDFVGRRILRYDGETGTLLGTVTNPTFENPIGIVAGPDGDLFFNAFAYGGPAGEMVIRIDGATGASEGAFATLPQQGWFPAFGPDGDLYTPTLWSGAIHRTDGATGSSLGTFATLPGAIGIAFLPGGDALVSVYDADSPDHGKVFRLDGATGAVLGEFVSSGPTSGGPVLHVPEPASLALLLAGGTLLMRRGSAR